MRREIAESLEKNRHEMEERLQLTKNFDLVERKLKVGDRDACLYFVDGFVKDEVLEKLMEFFQSLKPELLLENGKAFSRIFVPYVEVEILNSFEELTTQLLSGVACLLIDGIPCCVAVDCRTYPMRSVEEPEKDKVLRGSRDGFVETLVFNTALIRRRIRTPKLSMEILTTGKLSKTDIVLCYLDDRVDRELLSLVKNRIQQLKVEALTMNQESLAECLFRGRWFNPFPKFKYTERPDAAAAGILEGKLVILVDNSPSAMILPASVFDIMEEADDFYFPPVTGTYLRLTRFFIGLMTIFLTPVWLLLMQNPEWIPKDFQFIRVSEEINIPIFFQLLILELAIDGLKLAGHQHALESHDTFECYCRHRGGRICREIRMVQLGNDAYMAFVAMANYMQADYELGYALKFMRLLLLVLTAILNQWGLLLGFVLVCVFLATNRTISGESYLAPLLPSMGNSSPGGFSERGSHTFTTERIKMSSPDNTFSGRKNKRKKETVYETTEKKNSDGTSGGIGGRSCGLRQ